MQILRNVHGGGWFLEISVGWLVWRAYYASTRVPKKHIQTIPLAAYTYYVCPDGFLDSKIAPPNSQVFSKKKQTQKRSFLQKSALERQNPLFLQFFRDPQNGSSTAWPIENVISWYQKKNAFLNLFFNWVKKRFFITVHLKLYFIWTVSLGVVPSHLSKIEAPRGAFLSFGKNRKKHKNSQVAAFAGVTQNIRPARYL